jgi:hypothetical protein
MSRNSKNAQRIAKAKKLGAERQAGSKGPAKTTPLHGKKKAWWQKFPSYGAYIRGGKKGGQRNEEVAV